MNSTRKAGASLIHSRLFRAIAFASLLFAGRLLAEHGQAKEGPAPAPAHDGYAGSQACSRCHLAIYKSFTQTSMGRSMSAVTATPTTVTLPANAPSTAFYPNPTMNRRFEVYIQDQKLFQRETGLAADGAKSFEDTHQLEWVIGAADNGFGTIVRKDNFLFQAPLSFYARTKNWAPSPGYEGADVGFSRPIMPGCIFCHSGRPNSVPGSSGQFQDQPFAELAIGCERCHGPGEAHIQAMHASRRPGEKKQSFLAARVVNPANLTPYLADNICMACHQAGDTRILKPGKTYQDVRPGQPLDEVLSILMIPPTRQSPPSDDHVQHYYSMTLSKCYRATQDSAGQSKLSCITCHDPHVQPASEEAPAYFRQKCLTCHTSQSCKLPIEKRAQTKPADNCIGCHMPKRDIREISHSSATNHRIVTRLDEPFPDITFAQTTAELPDLIHLNPAPAKGAKSNPVPQLSLLQAYAELAQTKPEYGASYLKVLDQLEKSEPANPEVLAALGRRDIKNGDFQSAVNHLQQSVDSTHPPETAYADLADAYTHLGQPDKALPLIEQSIRLNPFNPVTQKALIVNLIALKQFSRAHDALRHYLEIFPQDDFMRKMLARVESGN
jgi:hypothetical protein